MIKMNKIWYSFEEHHLTVNIVKLAYKILVICSYNALFLIMHAIVLNICNIYLNKFILHIVSSTLKYHYSLYYEQVKFMVGINIVTLFNIFKMI